MHSFIVTDIITGKDSKRLLEERFSSKAFILDISYVPISIFNFFLVNGTLKLTIKNWELYFNENTFRIDKKLVASAGSDNRTKFLQLRSNDQKLNEIVVNRFWGTSYAEYQQVFYFVSLKARMTGQNHSFFS